jgi:hypothetical protein
MVALAAFLFLASGVGLFVAEAISNRNSPRTRAGLALLVIGLALTAVYVVLPG